MNQASKPNASETELKILHAARQVFLRDGLEGARMQTIADASGINKALLHYYFRSKDQLFEQVFYESANRFFPVVTEVLRSPLPIEEKIPLFVDRYFQILLENPHLTVFIVHEMHHHTGLLARALPVGAGNPADVFLSQYRAGVSEGRYRDVDPRQFLLTILSVCIFPFAARPMLNHFLKIESDRFPDLMQARKTFVIEQLLTLLKP